MKRILIVLMTLLILVSCETESLRERSISKRSVEDVTDIEVSDVCLDEKINVESNTAVLTGYDLWHHAESCDNIKYHEGKLSLMDHTKNGTLISSEIHLDAFRELVPSWNIDINNKSNVSIMVSVGNEEGFSTYFIMSSWSENYKASFKNQSDTYGKVYIDTIVSELDNIDRVKFKVIIKKDFDGETKIKQLAFTTVPSNYSRDITIDQLNDVLVDVPPRQQLSVPGIGNSICSPTSLSMVLNHYGYTDSQEFVAGEIYDDGAKIYGNWSFNASYAGGFNHVESHVEYIDQMSVVENYLNQGIPLVLSIKTRDKSELDGSIMAYPSGHLIVLIGLVEKEGVWYGVVNDPAEYQDELVRREYNLEQLLNVWNGYSYVIKYQE